MDHESEQRSLRHAMFLHCGVVAIRRPGNLYFGAITGAGLVADGDGWPTY